MAAIYAKRTVGVDVERSLKIAPADVAVCGNLQLVGSLRDDRNACAHLFALNKAENHLQAQRAKALCVRREKAALSSGCKSHPAKRSSRKQPEQSWR